MDIQSSGQISSRPHSLLVGWILPQKVAFWLKVKSHGISGKSWERWNIISVGQMGASIKMSEFGWMMDSFFWCPRFDCFSAKLDGTYFWTPFPHKKRPASPKICPQSVTDLKSSCPWLGRPSKGADDSRSCFHADRQRGTEVSVSGPNRRHKNFGGLLRVDSVKELLPHLGSIFCWEGWWTVLFRWAV